MRDDPKTCVATRISCSFHSSTVKVLIAPRTCDIYLSTLSFFLPPVWVFTFFFLLELCLSFDINDRRRVSRHRRRHFGQFSVNRSKILAFILSHIHTYIVLHNVVYPIHSFRTYARARARFCFRPFTRMHGTHFLSGLSSLIGEIVKLHRAIRIRLIHDRYRQC